MIDAAFGQFQGIFSQTVHLLLPSSSFDSSKLSFRHSVTCGEVTWDKIQPYQQYKTQEIYETDLQ